MMKTRLMGVVALAGMTAMACSDVSQPLPAGFIDPLAMRTSAGAIAAHRGVLFRASRAISTYMWNGGTFADETMRSDAFTGIGFAGKTPPGSDARNPGLGLGDNEAALYGRLHQMRNSAEQAIILLERYAPGSEVLRGELYAMKGMAVTLLGELFCSGIPLSTIEFDGDFQYKPGMTSEQVFTQATIWFDSAIHLAGDSSRIGNLARIGAARARINLGQWNEAMALLTGIDSGYTYRLPVWGDSLVLGMGKTVSEREGRNGLPFRSANDPRVRVEFYLFEGDSLFRSRKYTEQGADPSITLASYVEAILIRAEAELHNGGGAWLSTLNTLRTNGSYTVNAPGDTSWHAGTGGVAGLARLKDPGLGTIPPGKSVFDVRVDLLFRERAFWLFLEGHRPGDLRRLVRQYERDAEEVYPTGAYGPLGEVLDFRYGTDVVIGVPASEQRLNPYYSGCAHRGA